MGDDLSEKESGKLKPFASQTALSTLQASGNRRSELLLRPGTTLGISANSFFWLHSPAIDLSKRTVFSPLTSSEPLRRVSLH